MFSNTSGTANVLWIGLLVLMATGVALAANVHLQNDEEGEYGLTEQVAANSQLVVNRQAAARGALDAADYAVERAGIPAPAVLRVDPPTIERVRLDEVSLTPVELRQPAQKLPGISPADFSNTLVDRLIAASDLPPAPGPIAVESPDIREMDFEAVDLRVPELRRPPLPELPAIRP